MIMLSIGNIRKSSSSVKYTIKILTQAYPETSKQSMKSALQQSAQAMAASHVNSERPHTPTTSYLQRPSIERLGQETPVPDSNVDASNRL